MINDKDSKWSSTKNIHRRRKKVDFTLSDEAREKLTTLVEDDPHHRNRSRIVEDLIENAPAVVRRTKKKPKDD